MEGAELNPAAATAPPQTALVFCVHHKPWLMMSTLITLMAQENAPDADLFFIYNLGAGSTKAADGNPQLSPFDERVREVCGLKRARVYEIEYQNDDALDSGAWYKFIRDGHWRPYERVVFIGEGTLLAHPRLLSAMIELSEHHGARVIASAHEQRRIAREHFLHYCTRGTSPPSPADVAHDESIRKAFEIFARDPEFARLMEHWPADFALQTQNHVPAGGPPSPALRRFRARWGSVFGAPSSGSALAALPYTLEYWRARRQCDGPAAADSVPEPVVFVNGVPTPPAQAAQVTRLQGVGFHRRATAEYFGCATNHLMTRDFLERLSDRLAAFRIYDVLALPFAGTALEVLWGFIPIWLGVDKWFTDGFHRVRKDFVTYRREDYPVEMATYINRYLRGRVAVTWQGDYLKIGGVATACEQVRTELPELYFQPS